MSYAPDIPNNDQFAVEAVHVHRGALPSSSLPDAPPKTAQVPDQYHDTPPPIELPVTLKRPVLIDNFKSPCRSYHLSPPQHSRRRRRRKRYRRPLTQQLQLLTAIAPLLTSATPASTSGYTGGAGNVSGGSTGAVPVASGRARHRHGRVKWHVAMGVYWYRRWRGRRVVRIQSVQETQGGEVIRIEDLGGFLAMEHPTDTSAPFFTGVLKPANAPSAIESSAADAAPYSSGGAVGTFVSDKSADAATSSSPWYVRFAQYGARSRSWR